jgi:FkbM family methyltransferase
LENPNPYLPLVNFVRLQIAFRIAGYDRLVLEWIEGLFLPLQINNSSGLTGNLYFGFHEFHDMIFSAHFLDGDSVFLDIGANSGSYSLIAAGLKNATSYAFEPSTNSFNKLVDAIKINNLDQTIMPVKYAVGNPRPDLTHITLTKDLDTCNYIPDLDFTGEVERVEITSIDKFCANKNICKIDLIKIDTEGHELQVLVGAINCLKNKQIIAIIIENGYSSQIRRCDELLLDQGFIRVTYDYEHRILAKQPGNRTNSLWILEDQLQAVDHRLKSSRQINIFNSLI